MDTHGTRRSETAGADTAGAGAVHRQRTDQLRKKGASSSSGDTKSTSVSRRVYAMAEDFRALSDRVKVIIRVRPADDQDNETQAPSALEFQDEGKEINVFKRDGPVYWHSFGFDLVLGPSASQEQVYTSAAMDVVDNVVQGYNGTIMAYGQTGAGKTHTILNMEQGNVGVIPRAAAEIFLKTARRSDEFDFCVSMTCVQIYLETMQDLLRPGGENLSIREGAREVYLSGATCVRLETLEQCLVILAEADRNRKLASTKLNATSSRSHVVVMLKVERRRRGVDDPGVIGKLFLVDLAGRYVFVDTLRVDIYMVIYPSLLAPTHNCA